MTQTSGRRQGIPSRMWDRCGLLLLLVLGAIVLLTFESYGISNDEEVQHRYGEMLVDFYASGFTDRSAFAFKDLFYYGGLFDMAAIGLGQLLPWEIWDVRHLLSALVGVLGIAGAWRLGRFLGGPAVGLLAAVLLALTGAWYGGMFNHTKDIPFATAIVWSLYFLCRLLPGLPRPPWSVIALFGLAVGCTFGIRVGAVVIAIPFAVGVGAWVVQEGLSQAPARLWSLPAIGLRLAPAAVIAGVVTVLCWPWVALDAGNLLRALDHFSNLQFSIQTIFAGRIMLMTEVPASYLPVYLLIKLPLVMLIGLVLAAAYAVVRRQLPAAVRTSTSAQRLGLVATAFAGGFPVACFVIEDLPAYDGIRHFLFVVPPLAVLAAFGLVRTLSLLAQSTPRLAAAGAALLALALAGEAHGLVRLHPYEYVAYNELVGGLAGAQRRYVMDYWANTVPEATRALVAQLKRERPGASLHGPYKVWVCNGRDSFEAVAPKYLIWTRIADEADFYIAPTHLNCDAPAGWSPHLLKGRTLYTVERLGVPLAVVRDRRGITASVRAAPRG